MLHRRGHPVADRTMQALWAGFTRHGIAAMISDQDVPSASDLEVVWSINYTQTIAACERERRPYLVAELGYLGHRESHVSLAYNGLKRLGDHMTDDGGLPERWLPWAAMMQPWRSGGDVVIIMGQLPGDTACRGVHLATWYAAAVREASSWGVGNVIVRPHPRAAKSSRTLAHDLERAACAVTLNSNAGVDAILAGVPTIATDARSMAWDVSMHELAPQVLTQPEPDRHAWGQRLASSQWTHEEMASGEAWARLQDGPGGIWA